ncbi:RNA recognition motif domain-containing protein [Prochlorococcus marinus]|uniref:RNA recognition motif domain-containing protein n=1 Tax=Prochlorococcus marinus TaxID=1219 RepID=UPI0022B566C2|nr:RNA-binding protein [Prochlorococcus marinus]
MSIFVGNLPFRAEQEDVIELFSPFGEVANCSLPLERDTGRKRGFAFVEMADEAVEASAIESLQGAELMGRPLRINKAEPRGSAPRRGGGGYGGGGQGGYGGGGQGGYGGGGQGGYGGGGYGGGQGGYGGGGQGGYGGGGQGGYGGGGQGGYGGGGQGGYGGGGQGGYGGGGQGGYGGGGQGGYGGGGQVDQSAQDRPSGAKGWEDRSHGNTSQDPNGFDQGRSRRRRGASPEGGDDSTADYGGAES